MTKEKNLADITNSVKLKTKRASATSKRDGRTKEQIQDRLRAIGAKVTGCKADLEKRCVQFIQNNCERNIFL